MIKQSGESLQFIFFKKFKIFKRGKPKKKNKNTVKKL